MITSLPSTLHDPAARILDASGWFIPFERATHVVDLMPYETRGGVLRLDPLPGERFAKSTWHQADFLDPALRLPYPDKFFDYSVCGQTVEDLADPRPLLAELRRVSQAGCIETPSRLSEQTVGQRDRMTGAQGHPHHHWIVEAAGNRLLLSRKSVSLAGPPSRHAVPLRTFEPIVAAHPGEGLMCFPWERDFGWEILPDDEAVRRAQALVDSLRITAWDRGLDRIVRRMRRLKRGLLDPAPRATNVWWQEMLALSRPYSTIPL
jgi:SAM-dependent methyltransferase